MRLQSSGRNRLILVILAGATLLGAPAFSQAQHHGGGDGDSRSKNPSNPDNVSYQSSKPDPYGGQIYCPVTGKKLGLTQPPVAVQTSIGEMQPGFWGKLFGHKPTPGAVIYVYGEEVADRVRKNPQVYMSEVVADKSYFTFTYAQAPAQRPARASDGQAAAMNAGNPAKPAIVPVAGTSNAPPP